MFILILKMIGTRRRVKCVRFHCVMDIPISLCAGNSGDDDDDDYGVGDD